MGKIRLNVLGISYSQTQSGAYALVLTEEDGNRRIPIIVGAFEAQAIAIQLEGLTPPRPLTHDLFMSLAQSFKISLIEVVIHKLEEGVFFAKLLCDNGKDMITIDSRTSDAIALALRFVCPIFTTDEIMEKAGVVLDFEEGEKNKKQTQEAELMEKPRKKASEKIEMHEDNPYSYLDNDEIQKMLEDAINHEDYEKASSLRDELNKRRKL